MPFNRSSQSAGIILVLISFLIWGTAPLYFKSVETVSPLEILCHRIIWSLLFLLIIIISKRNLYKIWEVFKSPRFLFILITTATLISLNWLAYIWSIVNHHLMEASFGYFISPILNVILGMIFLKEKLNKVEIICFLMTLIGILIQFYEMGIRGMGSFIPIFLSLSFGFYALLRKKVAIDSFTGLAVETLLLSPIALSYLIYLAINNQLSFFTSTQISILLSLAGIITSVPLILYVAGSKNMALTKLGFLQYTSPTIQLFIAVYLFHEKISLNKMISFSFVWLALIIFLLNKLNITKHYKKFVTSLKT
ncbi:EamA family transporter RarD [Silvanigrella aquatica]|uniref:EamA domain-containing protein n=1 Tax=Silvanigrella aquatica TaxID=1915309 RepID=A0A1L4D1L7_9BACT|nr:EamA family transporter RarD [Silvanigrella aquatica]APJ04099.1 hypothetical protein AXG55_09340 [Silvanigrella aquatica]